MAEAPLQHNIQRILREGWPPLNGRALPRNEKEREVKNLLQNEIFDNITNNQLGPCLLFGPENDFTRKTLGTAITWDNRNNEWQFTEIPDIQLPNYLDKVSSVTRRPDFIFYNGSNAKIEATNPNPDENITQEKATNPNPDEDITQGMANMNIQENFLVLEIKVCQRNTLRSTPEQSKSVNETGKRFYAYNVDGELREGEWNRYDVHQKGCRHYRHLFARAEGQAKYYADYLRRRILGEPNVNYAVVVFFWDHIDKNTNKLVGYRWLAEDGTEDLNGLTQIP